MIVGKIILTIVILFQVVYALAGLARHNSNKKRGRYTDGIVFNRKTGRIEGSARPKDD